MIKERRRRRMAASSSHADMINIGVRSIHINTTVLHIGSNWTIGQIKTKLTELEKLKNKTIRVIYHGRDLGDAVLVSDARIHEGSIIHVSVSDKPSHSGNRRSVKAVPGPSAHQDVEEDSDSDEELTGFDRLREMGFTADDVQQFRMQFYLNHFRNLPAGQAQPAAQSEEMMRLENQWIDTQFNPQHAANQPQNNMQNGLVGTISAHPRQTINSGIDMVQAMAQLGSTTGNGFNLFLGLILGFLLGLIMLFWVGEPHLTRNTRVGMICGMLANIIIGFIAYNR